MPLLTAGLLARERAHNARFERAAAEPEAAQERVLRALMRRNEGSVFGREHGFASIKSAEEFAGRVPIRDYEGFRPYVDRMAHGESGVLTIDPLAMFTTTSGTTGEPKLIPVTEGWRAQEAALMRLWMYRAVRNHPGCFDKKLLLMASPAIEGRTSSGVSYGAMSGLIAQNAPRLARRQYAVPYDVVSLLDDHDDRYFLTMRLAMAQSLSAIAAPNATSLLRLADVAAVRSDDIIRATRDGTLGIPEGSLPDDECSRSRLTSLAARLRPDAARAALLEGVVAAHGSLLPPACWPDLELVGCWLGGSAGIHASKLRDLYGTEPAMRDLGLLASEGRFTIPVEDGTAAGPLAVHTTFYEFVSEGEMGDASPSVLTANQLKDGERYGVLLTGGNGLYRYDIDDVVEVRGFYRSTPKVAFVRKGRDVLNITGEKLHLNHVLAALRTAEEAGGLPVWQWRLIPDVDGCRYDLLIEIQPPVFDEVKAAAMLRAFDQSLGAQNIEYTSKRSSNRLGSPRLHVMRPGWSEAICRADFQDGRRETQHKWSALCDSWDGTSRAQVLTSYSSPWAACCTGAGGAGRSGRGER